MKLLGTLLLASTASAIHFLGPDGVRNVFIDSSFMLAWLIQPGDEAQYMLGYMHLTDHLCRTRQIKITTSTRYINLPAGFFPTPGQYAVCALKLDNTSVNVAPQAISGPFNVNP